MIETIISTTKQLDSKTVLSQLEIQNISGKVTYVIQKSSDSFEIKEERIRLIYSLSEGLSLSRNIGIECAQEEFILLSDDDVRFINGYDDLIVRYFKMMPDADIITFKTMTPEKLPFKNYSNKIFKHSFFSILRCSSIEIAYRKSSIIKSGLQFDTSFGLGPTKYPSNEENIFLIDALNKGLKIYFVPEFITIHPFETSSSLMTNTMLYTKGAAFRRMFGDFIGSILLGLFIVKKTNFLFLSKLKIALEGFISLKR